MKLVVAISGRLLAVCKVDDASNGILLLAIEEEASARLCSPCRVVEGDISSLFALEIGGKGLLLNRTGPKPESVLCRDEVPDGVVALATAQVCGRSTRDNMGALTWGSQRPFCAPGHPPQ